MITDQFDKYHEWYYQNVTEKVKYLGIQTLKNVSDLWNYQEILHQLKPAVIIEFGSYQGGSILYLKDMAKQSYALTVDINHVPDRNKREDIEYMVADSTSNKVTNKIYDIRKNHPGTAFFILDSCHEKRHVLNELIGIRQVTKPGDYIIVEDTNINGHPVNLAHGPGPYEALQEYMLMYPGDYHRDIDREQKFGFTFAAYLIRLSEGTNG